MHQEQGKEARKRIGQQFEALAVNTTGATTTRISDPALILILTALLYSSPVPLLCHTANISGTTQRALPIPQGVAEENAQGSQW